MSGAMPPLPQYAFTAWCSVKAEGQLYLLPYNDNDDDNDNPWSEALSNIS
jgi:hypothetical protein